MEKYETDVNTLPVLSTFDDPETLKYWVLPETLKNWVGVQRGQSYLEGRRCLFSLGWPPF